MPDDNDIIDGEVTEPAPEAVPYGPDEADWPEDSDEVAVEEAPDFDPLALIQSANAQKVRVLESVGVNLGFAIMATRLEAVVETLVGTDGDPRLRELNLLFETKLGPQLDEIAKQVKIQMAQRDAQEGAKLLSVPGGRS